MPKIQHYSRLSLAGATQQQINAVANKLNITPEEVLELSGEADPTKEKKFEGWILRQMAAKTVILPEDAPKVLELLNSFIVFSRTRKTEFTDINAYRTIHDLRKDIDTLIVKSFNPKASFTLRDLKRFPGVTVHEGEGFVIAEVSDKTSLEDLGVGTEWCTRRDYNHNRSLAGRYLNDSRTGALYIVYERTEGDVLKRLYQYTDNFDQFKNEKDVEVPFHKLDSDLIELMEEVAQKDPVVNSLFLFRCQENGLDVDFGDFITSAKLSREDAKDILSVMEKSDPYSDWSIPYEMWHLIFLAEERCFSVEDSVSEYPDCDVDYAVLHQLRNDALDEFLLEKSRKDVNILSVLEYYTKVVSPDIEEFIAVDRKHEEEHGYDDDLEGHLEERQKWEKMLLFLPLKSYASPAEKQIFYTCLFEHLQHKFPWKIERELKKFPDLWQVYKEKVHKTPDLPELEDFEWEE